MKKFCWLLLVCMLFLPALVFGETSIDGGGNLTFGYVPEFDLAIVSFDVVLYISPEEKFGGSVFAGMEIPVDSIYSEAVHFAQFTIGGTLNYDVLYALAQGYYIADGDNDFDYQTKLAVGVNYNMPYKSSKSLRYEPFFSSGVDLLLGYLPNLDFYSANIDAALYVRPDKLINGVIFGGVEVLMERARKYGGSTFSFCPYQDRYSFGVALNIVMLSLRVEHYCIHSVLADWLQFENKLYAENCTKISFGVQYQFPFKVRRIGW